MSVSGIESAHAALSAKYVPSTRGDISGAKSFATNTLQADTVELSTAAQKKLAASKSLLEQAHGGAAGAQETPDASDVYSRADLTNLFAQWGSAEPGSEYDFNEDGVVDAQDLASLLTKIGQSKPERTAEESPAYTRADIDGLYDAWNDGSDPARGADDRYDFDGDGRVNSSDLAELLARLSST